MTAALYDPKFFSGSRVRHATEPTVTREEIGAGMLPFPLAFAPHLRHPHVQALGFKTIQRLLALHALRYFLFTERLEIELVLPVAYQLVRGLNGLKISRALRARLSGVWTDEGSHAQLSDLLGISLVHAVALPDSVLDDPAMSSSFVPLVGRLDREAGNSSRQLVRIFAAMVSEMLISGTLRDICNHANVVEAVRRVVHDHSIDEGRHHDIFATSLREVFPQITDQRQREQIGKLLPKMIIGFLAPNLKVVAADLLGLDFSRNQLEEIMAWAYPPERQLPYYREASAKLLSHLTDNGAFENAATYDAFAAAGLIGS